jgi:hypothetical protein
MDAQVTQADREVGQECLGVRLAQPSENRNGLLGRDERLLAASHVQQICAQIIQADREGGQEGDRARIGQGPLSDALSTRRIRLPRNVVRSSWHAASAVSVLPPSSRLI